MEMILEKKHGTTNYGSKESGNQIGDDLLRMTPEETVYRSYYRMEQGLDKFSAEEESQIRNTYGDILSRYFPPTEAEPYCLHDATVNESSPIVVRKRSRYFPAVLYHRPCFELIYLYSGQCTHICKGQQYELRQGDFCLLEYGASHRIFNNSDYSILIELLIFPKILNKICATLLSENSVLSNFFHNALYGHSNYPLILFHTGTDSAVKNFVTAMLSESQQRTGFYYIFLESFLNALFVILLRQFRPYQAQPVALEHAPIPEIMDYITKNYLEITLADLAASFDYSVPHMSKLIREACGVSYSAIVRQLKMRRAAWLLQHTSLSMTQIASEIRCVDTSHFGKNFRKEFQMTPKEYRQLFSIRQEHNL
ncbi:MAG: AraC family transcriptional regulator [Oscillospiraceae bacterium]